MNGYLGRYVFIHVSSLSLFYSEAGVRDGVWMEMGMEMDEDGEGDGMWTWMRMGIF